MLTNLWIYLGVVAAILLANLLLSLVTAMQVRRLSRNADESDDTDLASILREEFRLNRTEAAEAAKRLREEVAKAQKDGNDAMIAAVKDLGKLQQESLNGVEKRVKELVDSNEARQEKLRETVNTQLKQIQDSNEKKLEQMRVTVDEKLQSTLEKRLGESFKLVSERLESVQKGLGEMQNLASGVGDLKRVLTNVKTRGTWGEYQLGDILEQILAPDQYEKNVQPDPESSETVEYAVKLPGKEGEAQVWLPIDAKFPQEDYQRLLDAAEAANKEDEAKSTAALIRAIQNSAKDISAKYLAPPHTTDFAIMFLPTEGLYAEVLRQPGMMENLQQNHRIVVAGPMTLSAILSSLRMGFQTLAIEQSSSEVRAVLSAVKTEFGKFGEVLATVKRHLNRASKSIDSTEVRTRVMEKKLDKLDKLEPLPEDEATELLGLADEPPLAPESVDDENRTD